MSWISVVLLEPVPPRIPTVMPEAICRSMSRSANFFAVAEYLKDTPSKSTEPSRTSVTGFSGLLSAELSDSTSQIRLADSADIVRMTYIMDIIIRDMSIWKP